MTAVKVFGALCVALWLGYSLTCGQSKALLGNDRDFLKSCGSAKSSVKTLSLQVISADIVLRHENRNDIEIKSNYKENWSISPQGSIRQLKATTCPAGVFTNANGRFVMRGQSIKISGNTATIDGKQYETKPIDDADPSSLQKGAMIGPKGILVNGRKVVEGPVDPNNPDRPEVLQILVPKTFTGVLAIGGALEVTNGIQTDQIKIDYWKGSITVDGQNANLSVGDLSSKKRCLISVVGKNRVQVSAVKADDLKASTKGPEANLSIQTLTAKHALLRAENSSIFVSSGKVEHGKIENAGGQISVPSTFIQETSLQSKSFP
jgi:hypothetical protein